MAISRNTPADGLAVVALTLPWLNPFAAGPSPPLVQSLLSWTCFACLLVMVALRPRPFDLSMVSARSWLIAAMLSCIAAMVQYFGFSDQWAPWINRTGLGEAFANLRQRNQFATLTNLGLLALWWKVRGEMETGDTPPGPLPQSIGSQNWRRAWVFAAAALLATGNAASASRTGLVQLLLIAALWFLWGELRRPTMRLLLLVAIVGYGVAMVGLPLAARLEPFSTGMLARLQTGDPACASRLTLWSNVLHLVAMRPWLGWGWGELDYAHFMTLYPGARFCDILDNAHNLPLHLAVELGVPAAVLACGAAGWLIWRAAPWRERLAGRQMAWAALAVILLHSMLEYPLWYGPFKIAAVLCVWILCTTKTSHLPQATATTLTTNRAWHPSTAPAGALVAGVFAAAITIYVGYTAWDYYRISQIYLPSKERATAYRENTLEKIQGSWMFRDQVQFAELTTTDLTQANAAHLHALALAQLHFSPEAKVAEKLIESAVMLGKHDEALAFLARYRAAFPADYARWLKTGKALGVVPLSAD